MLSNLLDKSGLKKDAAWSKFLTQWLIIALLLHLVAAVYSSGFYHADEHFQILEFLNYKLGKSPVQDLPLEYRHFMRPWLLPSILYGITTILNFLGIQNPFYWALSYRLFASFVGWLSLAGLSLCCYHWFPKTKFRNWAVVAFTLLWYLPAFHSRHSSENLGGSVFFIGLASLFLGSYSNPPENSNKEANQNPFSLVRDIPASIGLISGILFGLSFEFRYQLGVMVVGVILWLLCISRISIKQCLPILLGILIPVGLGTLADRWGYGQWVCAPWRYLEFNLIQNHVADSDTTPWWDYFRRAFTESWPFLGFLLLLSFPIAWALNPRHILTWSMFPLFLVHEIIGHKELRFLFPLVHTGGVLPILALSSLGSKLRLQKLECFRPPLRWVYRFLFLLNGVGLICLTLVPAWMPIRFYRQLYEFRPQGFQLYYQDDSLFNFGGATMNFYRPPGLPLTRVNSFSELRDRILQNQSSPTWFFNAHSFLPAEAENLKPWCQIEFSTLPSWIENFDYRNVLKRMTNWTLFRCSNTSDNK